MNNNERGGNVFDLDKARPRIKFPAIKKETQREEEVLEEEGKKDLDLSIEKTSGEQSSSLIKSEIEGKILVRDYRNKVEVLAKDVEIFIKKPKKGMHDLELSSRGESLRQRIERLIKDISMDEETYKQAMNKLDPKHGQVFGKDGLKKLEERDFVSAVYNELTKLRESLRDINENLLMVSDERAGISPPEF